MKKKTMEKIFSIVLASVITCISGAKGVIANEEDTVQIDLVDESPTVCIENQNVHLETVETDVFEETNGDGELNNSAVTVEAEDIEDAGKVVGDITTEKAEKNELFSDGVMDETNWSDGAEDEAADAAGSMERKDIFKAHHFDKLTEGDNTFTFIPDEEGFYFFYYNKEFGNFDKITIKQGDTELYESSEFEKYDQDSPYYYLQDNIEYTVTVQKKEIDDTRMSGDIWVEFVAGGVSENEDAGIICTAEQYRLENACYSLAIYSSGLCIVKPIYTSHQAEDESTKVYVKGLGLGLSETQVNMVTEIQVKEGISSIECSIGSESAGYIFTNVKKVTLPSTLQSIGDETFRGCRNLAEINIPEGVISIGDSAFKDCKSLTAINLPDSLEIIGAGAFRNCEKLYAVNVSDNSSLKHIDSLAFGETAFAENAEGLIQIGNVVIGYAGEDSVLEIPDTVITIEDSAFVHNKTIKKVIIPGSVRYLGQDAFNSASALEEVVIKDGLEMIDYYVFLNCPNLRKITIPESVTYIEDTSVGYIERFEDDISEPYYDKNTNLTIYCTKDSAAYKYAVQWKFSYEIIESVPKEGDTFYYNGGEYIVTGDKTAAFTWADTQNTKVTIEDKVKYKNKTFSVTEVENKALYNNTVVKEIVIGNRVKSIDSSAFRGCKNLKKITIGSAVTTIGSKALYGCGRLSVITIKSKKLTTVGGSAFKGIYGKAKIKVPASKLTVYKKLLKNKGQGKNVKIIK